MDDQDDWLWASSHMECVICGREQGVVFPFIPPDDFPPALECIECGHMNESELERIKKELKEQL